jgi:hypothetical protein
MISLPTWIFNRFNLLEMLSTNYWWKVVDTCLMVLINPVHLYSCNFCPGRPDWANFRLLGDCLLWPILWELSTKVAQLLGGFFSDGKSHVLFWKNCVLGDSFTDCFRPKLSCPIKFIIYGEAFRIERKAFLTKVQLVSRGSEATKFFWTLSVDS